MIELDAHTLTSFEILLGQLIEPNGRKFVHRSQFTYTIVTHITYRYVFYGRKQNVVGALEKTVAPTQIYSFIHPFNYSYTYSISILFWFDVRPIFIQQQRIHHTTVLGI